MPFYKDLYSTAATSTRIQSHATVEDISLLKYTAVPPTSYWFYLDKPLPLLKSLMLKTVIQTDPFLAFSNIIPTPFCHLISNYLPTIPCCHCVGTLQYIPTININHITTVITLRPTAQCISTTGLNC